MGDIWYQCDECVFATNGTRLAREHQEDTGHTVTEEQE
jgi:hypothetical protein